MKFTLSWLKHFLDTDIDLKGICDALTAIGLEVEEVIDQAQAISCFKVAKIIEVSKHPEADKLNVCKVDNGKEVVQIICGAKNVAPNMYVVLASEGDIIPASGLKIEKKMLRGVESNGMICSAEELGLEDNSDGIMELPQNLLIGGKLIDQLPELAECIIEIALTPNRSDCLGVYGIARDLAAYGLGSLKEIKISNIESTASENINVVVENENACPLYVSRYFASIKNKVSAPKISEALRAIGKQTISAVVDITNYLMFSYNRPMHIYDADKIIGKLKIRSAKQNEKFFALDGKEYVLEPSDVVIADDEKICALAGIIGGEESKCDLSTKNILLELAVFDKKSISRTARRLGIDTDSKYRNERGVDYNFTIDAVEIVSQQITEVCGGQAGDIKVVGLKKKNENSIEFDTALTSKILGLHVEYEQVVSILEKLGFGVKKNQENILSLSIPSWRHDINIQEDIVEEVIRIFGYNKLESKPLSWYGNVPNALSSENKRNIEIKKTLAARGYTEIVTWSFMSSKVSEKFGLSSSKLNLKNPINDNLDQLRYSIMPNLLQTVKNNKLRSFDNLAFFELGPVYQEKQKKCLAAVRAGFNTRKSIYADKRSIDFFDLKKDVINALKVFSVDSRDVTFSLQDKIEWYHPGKSATISYKNKVIGCVGEVHPAVLKMLKIGGTVAAFELFLEQIDICENRQNISFSDYQLVEKDIAFVVASKTPVSEIERVIYSLEDIIIKDFYIFDIYSDDEQLGKDKKSVAIKLFLQSDTKTLNKEEIDNIFNSIILIVETQLEGKLRTF